MQTINDNKQSRKLIRVAIAGQPNAGKTLLFNLLTGGRARSANWPGTTVEKRSGVRWHRGYKLEITDLPGLYTFRATSLEQEIAARFLVEESPDVVILVVDASNISRGIYLALQLAELKPRLVIALNKIDLAESLGLEVDSRRLSSIIGCPVVETIAVKARGLRELLDAVIEVYERDWRVNPPSYGSDIDEVIDAIEEVVASKSRRLSRSSRRIAIGYIEGDDYYLELVRKEGLDSDLAEVIKRKGGGIEDYSFKILEARVKLSDEIADRVTLKRQGSLRRLSDAIDRAVLDKHLAIPLLLSVFWALFLFTFSVSEPIVELVDSLLAVMMEALRGSAPRNMISSLVIDGILPGVGAVLALLPVLFAFFLGFAVLEDTGYLARVSALLDPMMTRAGLTGRSIIPLALCLGCNVVGVKATRVISDTRERLTTILVAPFITCPARLPVYVVISSIVFGGSMAPIALMYLLSFTVALALATTLRKTILHGREPLLVTELPEYTKPSVFNVKTITIDKLADFAKRASTVILLGSIAIWFLLSIGGGSDASLEDSLGARIAMMLEPVFEPLGFDWRAVLALISGLIAKELVVSTMAIIAGVEEEGLIGAMRAEEFFDPASGMAFMVFTLLYTPCLATIASIWSETRSIKWTIFSLALSALIAYGTSLITYHIVRVVI